MAETTDGPTVSTGSYRRRDALRTGAVGILGAASGCVSALAGGPVDVGFVLPFEGVYGRLGRAIQNGFELRVEQLGGLGGNRVTYHRRNTNAKPERGTNMTRKLLTETGVDLVVGPVSSAVARKMVDPITSEESALWLNPNATDDQLAKRCLRYHFRTPGSIWHYSMPMGAWIRQRIGGRAALTYADYTAGKQYARNFRRGYTEAGGTVIEEIPVPIGTEQYSQYIEQLSELSVDVIYSFFAGSDAINYITQLHESGLTAKVTQTGAGFLTAAGTLPEQGETALGTVTILNYTPWKQTRRNGEFVTNYHDQYGQFPDTYACDGYDCASVADSAVGAAGTNVEGMISAAEGLRVDSPRGYLKLDADTHDAVQGMDIREVVWGPEGKPINRVIDTVERKRAPWSCE